MNDAGYIYILINTSAPGIVKIGKTQRDPEARAKELSAATGVPTPFILAFESYFADCSRAEQYVHTRLAAKRLANNREFFQVQLREAIEAVLEAERVLVNLDDDESISHISNYETDDDVDELTLDNNEPWQAVFDQANACCFGEGDTLQDLEEALSLYKQAAKLGAWCAYIRLGSMYLDARVGPPDSRMALKYFKEGAQSGDDRCWAEMTMLYEQEHNIWNIIKCWDKYFEGKHITNEKVYPNPLAGQDREGYAIEYIFQMLLYGRPIQHIDKLRPIKNLMLARLGPPYNYSEEYELLIKNFVDEL